MKIKMGDAVKKGWDENSIANSISDKIKKKFPNKVVTSGQVDDAITDHVAGTPWQAVIRDHKYFYSLVFDGLKDGGWKITASKKGTTIIDLSVGVDAITNFNQLPPEIQKVIKSADNIQSSGFQELIGHINRKVIFGEYLFRLFYSISS